MGDYEEKIKSVKKSLDTLILIELCKAGATYPQIREIMGAADNNVISKIKSVFGRKLEK